MVVFGATDLDVRDESPRSHDEVPEPAVRTV
jgi:hypothetical protein